MGFFVNKFDSLSTKQQIWDMHLGCVLFIANPVQSRLKKKTWRRFWQQNCASFLLNRAAKCYKLGLYICDIMPNSNAQYCITLNVKLELKWSWKWNGFSGSQCVPEKPYDMCTILSSTVFIFRFFLSKVSTIARNCTSDAISGLLWPLVDPCKDQHNSANFSLYQQMKSTNLIFNLL